jgi:2-C-methyl-D-erythritol 4-phosphate cytidylyltransferase
MKAIAIIVGAGRGIRMKSTTPKQYLLLKQTPILSHVILAFNACRDIHQIILVVPPEDIHYCREKIIAPIDMHKPIDLVGGGEQRQDSVRQGLLAIDNRESVVVVHDGVRPLVEEGQISACIAGTDKTGACILAVPVSDTLKQANSNSRIEATVSRSGLWRAQTPQAFHYKILMKAHEAARREGFSTTDDSALVERIGTEVCIVPGSRRNIKITDPEDLEMAEALLKPNIE